MYKRGLVVGKFYPPHSGHKYLIDAARAQSEHLTVMVCGHPGQTVSAELRAQWLRQIHPTAEVMVVDDSHLDDDDSKGWAEATLKWIGRPDAVFTSEDYGDGYAHFMKTKHVRVFSKRLNPNISGTNVRRDPLGMWQHLDPVVRAYFAKRVCVVGAESTGTTTMARALAEHYRTIWVPEYGREYSEQKIRFHDSNWNSAEFMHIALEQNRREDQAAGEANKLLICDTDSFATSIWHERYMGFKSPEVDRISTGRRYDLYLLTGTDVPFEQDGTRDGEHLRAWMHQRFARELKKRGKPYVLLSGSHQQRLTKAITAVDQVLATKPALLTV